MITYHIVWWQLIVNLCGTTLYVDISYYKQTTDHAEPHKTSTLFNLGFISFIAPNSNIIPSIFVVHIIDEYRIWKRVAPTLIVYDWQKRFGLYYLLIMPISNDDFGIARTKNVTHFKISHKKIYFLTKNVEMYAVWTWPKFRQALMVLLLVFSTPSSPTKKRLWQVVPKKLQFTTP